jgi:hypothetical protein
MYEAVNKGLQLARGTLLAYVNSDNMYLPWSVEVAAELLSRGADLVFGDMGLSHAKVEDVSPEVLSSFRSELLHAFEAIAQPTVFWSSEVTTRLGDFDTSFQLI